MAIDPKYLQGPGGFYDTTDGSGPYAIDSDGNATLIGSSGGGGGSSDVTVTNFPETQPVSGPLTNAQLTAVTGTAAQTAVTTDPTAAGQTVVALLRGILSEMQAQTALLQTIATNTEPSGG